MNLERFQLINELLEAYNLICWKMDLDKNPITLYITTIKVYNPNEMYQAVMSDHSDWEPQRLAKAIIDQYVNQDLYEFSDGLDEYDFDQEEEDDLEYY